MKKIKALLAIVLVFTVFCFAGCSKEVGMNASNEKMLVGQWDCKIDLSEAMAKEMADQGLGEMGLENIPFNVYLNMEFTEEKTCSLKVDSEATLEAITDYLDELMVVLIDYMYDVYEAQTGMTEDEINSYFNDFMGMSFTDYITSTMAESMKPEDLAASFNNIDSGEGYYKLVDDKLYIENTEEELEGSEKYATCVLAGNVMTLDNGTADFFADFEEVGIKLPLVFEKAE